jgi:hypothetical protein
MESSHFASKYASSNISNAVDQPSSTYSEKLKSEYSSSIVQEQEQRISSDVLEHELGYDETEDSDKN